MTGSPTREGASPFVWPPGRDDDEQPRPSPPTTERSSSTPGVWSRIRTLALDVEAALLPRAAEPLSRRLAEGDVVFDGPEAYCDRCGGDIGPYETEDVGCAACAGDRLPWDRFLRLGAYEGGLAQAVQEVKFRRFRALGAALGRELGKALVRAGAERERPVLVPIPTTPRRRMTLGLDHTMTLARGASRALGAPVVRALGRRPGPTQLDVPLSERPSNVARVFYPRAPARRLRGRTAILIDDVCTTGATFRAAARKLHAAGDAAPGSLWAAAVSVARPP